jgi:NADPH-dependent curcumin reductase CurA
MKTVTSDPATKDTAIANATATLATATAPLAAAASPISYFDGGGSATNHFQVGDTIMFNFNKAIATITSATINDAGVTTSHTHAFGSTLVISTANTSAYVVLGAGTTVAAGDTVTIVGTDQSGTSATVNFTLA